MMCGTAQNQLLGRRGERSRCVKIAGKGGFATQMFNLLAISCETTRQDDQRIVTISMRFCYHGPSSVQERFREVHMGNPGHYRREFKMKQNLLALPLLIVLAGCVTVKDNYHPKRTETSEPPLNTVTTAYVGGNMLRKSEYSEHDALYLGKKIEIGSIENYIFVPGYYLKKGEDAGSEFYVPSGGSDSGRVIVGPLADPFQAIRIDKKSGKFCCVSTKNTEVCTNEATYEKKTRRTASSDSFQQTLIYSGKSGDIINVGYREFSHDLARPTFNNEVEYDLSESRIIGYKGARLEIIEATNESIKYKVIQNFNRAKN